MANPPSKTPSILLEAIKFAASVPPETPYDELARTALNAGWAWYLRQSGVADLANSRRIDFDVMLGKTEGAELAMVDTISVVLNDGPGPVSTFARQVATQSLLHLFFGRLPPEPVRTPAPMQSQSSVRREAEDPNIYDDDAPRRRPIDAETVHTPLALKIVERQTADGLPIFVDLFALGDRGPDIATAVLDVVEAILPSINTVPMLMALMSNNPDLIPFFQDLADVPQRQELKAMLDDRKAAIEAMPAPRRRQVV